MTSQKFQGALYDAIRLLQLRPVPHATSRTASAPGTSSRYRSAMGWPEFRSLKPLMNLTGTVFSISGATSRCPSVSRACQKRPTRCVTRSPSLCVASAQKSPGKALSVRFWKQPARDRAQAYSVKIFPGFMMFFGSSARLMVRIMSTAPLPVSVTRKSIL